MQPAPPQRPAQRPSIDSPSGILQGLFPSQPRLAIHSQRLSVTGTPARIPRAPDGAQGAVLGRELQTPGGLSNEGGWKRKSEGKGGDRWSGKTRRLAVFRDNKNLAQGDRFYPKTGFFRPCTPLKSPPESVGPDPVEWPFFRHNSRAATTILVRNFSSFLRPERSISTLPRTRQAVFFTCVFNGIERLHPSVAVNSRPNLRRRPKRT